MAAVPKGGGARRLDLVALNITPFPAITRAGWQQNGRAFCGRAGSDEYPAAISCDVVVDGELPTHVR
jgi:hypothetical protein